MSLESPDLKPGQIVLHSDLGEGAVISVEGNGYVKVFFRTHGEHRVPVEALLASADLFDRIVSGFAPASPDQLEKLWLAVEAEELPLMESAATLTSAKVDLLPHQVVLVHRIANASPKRFLIADEVGLGKTIETALILRELASRGELQRALMVVPAGLVENWRRELNEVFNLDFEVFGSEGDVTDRRSNAFAKHNRLIASVDTLKRRSRIKRLLEAPMWDLVVFDEAHHLSVYRNGNHVTKTENFKLAEALRNHARDLLLLSATPHQGDHFRFWMLIRLLNPGLFEDVSDMIKNRHRLNAVVLRRTKADACAPDGSPLFARRIVNTEGFNLSEPEKQFYDALMAYLRDGYNLAAQQGSQGRALGFVMTIFQKIAASSFAAIRSTLQRRLLMLTIQEAIERDELLDVTGRNDVLDQAREIIHEGYSLAHDTIGNAQTEQVLIESKIQLLRNRTEAQAFLKSDVHLSDTEIVAALGEETAAYVVTKALPQERSRIHELLDMFPDGAETKTKVLRQALSQIWRLNPDEKVVVFATYLGSVNAIRQYIEEAFPDKGVEVLKGGDHGAKTAAQKRFRRIDGPRVLVCTAAGREGINLQFARVLFNYDLPWNPMDLEQRIGRIHRYGQQSTAQIYNLVAADTIEGQIFLMLEDKLADIAEALGKVDENGQIAEDLRAQVLGQLGSQLSYDRIYQDALSDPTLKRTREELEVAITNANLARKVVFELFQDLDRFNLGDYKKHDDEGRGMQRLLAFVTRSEQHKSRSFERVDPSLWKASPQGHEDVLFTSDRERAMQSESLELLGIEHPYVKDIIEEVISLRAEKRAVVGYAEDLPEAGLLTIWKVTINSNDGKSGTRIIRIGVTTSGERALWLENDTTKTISLTLPTAEAVSVWLRRTEKLKTRIHDLLHRQLVHSGIVAEDVTYATRMIAVYAIDLHNSRII